MSATLKAVLVGCGGMSATWLNAIAEIDDLQMVGLVDIKKENALKRADEYNLTEAVIGTDAMNGIRPAPGTITMPLLWPSLK